MADPYRDDDAANAIRLKQLDEVIADKEGRFTPVFWERVAPLWGVPRTVAPSAAQARQGRADRIAALDRAIERATFGPPAAPELPPRPEAEPGLLTSLGRATTIKPPGAPAVLAVARKYDPAAELRYAPGRRWVVRFIADGAPVEIVTEYRKQTNQSLEVATATTTVSPAARLSLKPEGILQDLLEMVGFREIELGDATFDPVFIIKGDRPSAEALLDGAARSALLALNFQVAPTVDVGGGLAKVQTSTVTEAALAQLTTLLSSWHGAPSPVALLEAPDAEDER